MHFSSAHPRTNRQTRSSCPRVVATLGAFLGSVAAACGIHRSTIASELARAKWGGSTLGQRRLARAAPPRPAHAGAAQLPAGRPCRATRASARARARALRLGLADVDAQVSRRCRRSPEPLNVARPAVADALHRVVQPEAEWGAWPPSRVSKRVQLDGSGPHPLSGVSPRLSTATGHSTRASLYTLRAWRRRLHPSRRHRGREWPPPPQGSRAVRHPRRGCAVPHLARRGRVPGM